MLFGKWWRESVFWKKVMNMCKWWREEVERRVKSVGKGLEEVCWDRVGWGGFSGIIFDFGGREGSEGVDVSG